MVKVPPLTTPKVYVPVANVLYLSPLKPDVPSVPEVPDVPEVPLTPVIPEKGM